MQQQTKYYYYYTLAASIPGTILAIETGNVVSTPPVTAIPSPLTFGNDIFCISSIYLF